MLKAPFLPIRDLVIFPNVVTPIYVGRANSIATLEKAIANKTKLVLGLQKDASQENPTFDGDIYEVGVIANIVQIIRMPNNNIKVLVEAENRVKIKNIEKEENEYVTTFGNITKSLIGRNGAFNIFPPYSFPYISNNRKISELRL